MTECTLERTEKSEIKWTLRSYSALHSGKQLSAKLLRGFVRLNN